MLKGVLRHARPAKRAEGAAMEFAFSDEQEMIRASAEGFLADVSDSSVLDEEVQTPIILLAFINGNYCCNCCKNIPGYCEWLISLLYFISWSL
ncbi:hypothetical protein KW841_19560 [Pseudomonas sp. PDM28]|uniref:hypothetical protein n=1 Tax=Pseudomonas sp. PDM28 TaxID=2854770 RepID=UPI001C452E11|nr:hypothetical protein [Pseudomonas sp. PDM28]MBV7554543.1 hypothetical protein [Pseudomonas sp. PDM28]